MQNLKLRVAQFDSGDVGIYADKTGPEIIRIHRLRVQHASGATNFNQIYTLYPEHASTLLEVFSPHPSTTEIKASAIYEEIDNCAEVTAAYVSPT